MGVYLPARLPSTYQEVEYIQSSGTQWVDTGLFASNNIQVETKVEVTQTAQDKPVFGSVKSGSGSNSISGYYHLTCYNSKWYYGLNNQEGNAGTYSTTVGTQYTIIYNGENSGLYINGTNIATLTGTVGISSSTLGISYRGYTSGTANRKGQWKYFYFKMYDKSTSQYVRNFVPCYRKSDSVIGMYDLVNGTFYTNAGTGTFTKGPDVYINQLKAAYIGYARTPGTNTLAYYPLKEDVLDYSGNGNNGTGNPASFDGGVANYTTSSGSTNIPYSLVNGTQGTISVWLYLYSNNTCNPISQHTSSTWGLVFRWGTDGSSPAYVRPSLKWKESGGNIVGEARNYATGWYLYTAEWDSSNNYYFYLNGEFVGSQTSRVKQTNQNVYIGYDPGQSGVHLNAKVSELIIEDKIWTATEVSNYYNSTKANYGIS